MKKSKIAIIILGFILIMAVAALVIIIKLPDVRSSSKVDMAQKAEKKGRIEEAIDLYEEAIDINSQCVAAYVGLANIYLDEEEYEKALEIATLGYEETDDSKLKRLISKCEKNIAPAPVVIEYESTGAVEAVTADSGIDEGYATEAPAETAEAAAEIITADEIYDAILQDYIDYYNGNKSYNELSVTSYFDGEYSSIMNYGSYDNPGLSDQEYFMSPDFTEYMYSPSVELKAVFYDVNNDGMDEMFIYEIYGEFEQIHDVWTIVDNKPKFVGYYDVRFSLVISDEGELYEFSSGGWNSSNSSRCSLNYNGEIVVEDYVSMTPEGTDSFYCEHNGVIIAVDEYDRLTSEMLDVRRLAVNSVKNVKIAIWEK